MHELESSRRLPAPLRALAVAQELVVTRGQLAAHFTVLAREADDTRRAALQIRGRLVVDISSYVVRRRSRLAVLRTADALIGGGYLPGSRTARILREYADEEGYTWVSDADLAQPA